MNLEWWNSLNHGGLLISNERLAEHYGAATAQFPTWLAEKLRKQVFRFQNAEKRDLRDQLGALVDTILNDIAFVREGWLSGRAIDAETWSVKLATGETQRPQRVWQDGNGNSLPVFVEDPLNIKRIGQGRGRRSTARVLEWLRRKGEPLALITNGLQWRLMYAGPDFDSWCEWETSSWFVEGQLGPQVEAFRILLGEPSLRATKAGEANRLLQAIRDTRKGQSELSEALGERVRQAVELLIQSHADALPALLEGPNAVQPRDIYHAATRMIMRMVVILFAEARGLLDRQNEIYEGSYGLNGLRAQLFREASQSRERLRHRQYAWPRMLALSRMLFYGSGHQRFILPAYGGALFQPGDRQSKDPILRALSAFESVAASPPDAVVMQILRLITEAPVKKIGPMPVDFSSLSTEYIGILYEGLLDYELRQATEPVVFLNLGPEPALPLSRLEELDESKLKALLKELGKKQKSSVEEGDEAEEEEEQEEETTEVADDDDGDDQHDLDQPDDLQDDRQRQRQRATAWAEMAAVAAGLVKKPRGKKTDAAAAEAVAAAGRALVKRLFLPGEWYLVRWGGTRKGQGTFYTRPGLSVPTTQRTLAPLLFQEGDRSRPRTPDEILDVKVCDPAMGSGAFLVAALRIVTSALADSLFEHRWITRFADAHGIERLRADNDPAKPDWFKDVTRGLETFADDAEDRLRARLKRVVVEHCIYGVDFDAMATELAKMALWIETMDRELPFGFLDHKLKHGNSLVGAWFDQFVDYPVLALERAAGDKDHKGVHFGAGVGEAAIKTAKNELKEAMGKFMSLQGVLGESDEEFAKRVTWIHDVAMDALQELHRMSIRDATGRAEKYRAAYEHKDLRNLKQRLDGWCAIWFWPSDKLDLLPMPNQLIRNQWTEESLAVLEDVIDRYRFFHWELEFPDVFSTSPRPSGGEGSGVRGHSGFGAIIGNPPWETLQPNSKEFFSNLDPLYRGYGKQEALAKQQELFASEPIEAEWREYIAAFKAQANYFAFAAHPFGDPIVEQATFNPVQGKGSKDANASFHSTWRTRRAKRKGYSDPQHPYRCQGDGKPYTYKLFLERAYALLRPSGRLGFIVPSGLYSDQGSIGLRKLFLDRCEWTDLFGFENREKVFKIDSRFKFCATLVKKGGRTEAIRTAFMRRRLSDWETPERFTLEYPRELIERFSPKSLALLEVGSPRDLEVLEKIYANSVLLGDTGPGSWGITYRQGDFNMTSDSKLFPPREKWEAQGYAPDEYGRWIGPNGEVALPLYQGIMMSSFTPLRAAFLKEDGRGKWVEGTEPYHAPQPQFLIDQEVARRTRPDALRERVLYRGIARSTDQRTLIGCVGLPFPAGNSLSVLNATREKDSWALLAVLGSVVGDFQFRRRVAGTNLNWFFLEEIALPGRGNADHLAKVSLSLSGTNNWFAPAWLAVASNEKSLRGGPWKTAWAVTTHERARVKAQSDAICASIFRLDLDDLLNVLRECAFPAEALANKTFVRELDQVGFWRVDKDKDPELRHTVLTLAAFRDLQPFIDRLGLEAGIEAFCSQNDGEGWMIPEELDLEELFPGEPVAVDVAAGDLFSVAPRGPRPVRERLGPRFYDWQLEQDVEESWKECEYHARQILGEEGFAELMEQIERGEEEPEPEPISLTDLKSNQPALFETLQPALDD